MAADEFAYTDPVDGSVTAHQGIRIELPKAVRASSIACPAPAPRARRLRVYLERFEPDPARHAAAPEAVLAPLAAAAASLADIPGILGRSRPDVVA